jgi:hypothetical protein
MIKDSRVMLVSLNGEFFAPRLCDPSKNYWLLIGEMGNIIKNDYCSGALEKILPYSINIFC